MTTWWNAVCDEHRCYCTVLITFNGALSSLMGQGDDCASYAAEWLEEHYMCKLRLIQSDEDYDNLDGYRNDGDPD